MKRIMFLALSLVFILSFTLAGCSSNNGGSSASGGKKQSTLVYGRGADATSLDPAIVTDGESFKVTKNIYDTLVGYKGQTTDLEPDLAKSWDISKDGLTYTFHLRDDVKFHDGTKFNADAVVFNFDRWMNGKDSGKFAYYGSMFGGFKGDEGHIIDSVTAKDDNTVVFKLKRPSAPFLKDLAMSPFAIASPTAVKKYGKDYGRKAAVGTGPFKFQGLRSLRTLLQSSKMMITGKKASQKLIKSSSKVIPDNTGTSKCIEKRGVRHRAPARVGTIVVRYTRPCSRVPLRYRIRCFSARQWTSPGLDINLQSLLTVKVMSGLVQHAMKLARAIRLRYSVALLFVHGAGGTVLLREHHASGVGTGLQSCILDRSSRESIKLACEYS